MTRGEVVLLDTNVLLAATDRSRAAHHASREFLTRSARSGIHCAVTGQVLREYLVVATRPIEVNGLGLALEDGLANTKVFRARCSFLEESEPVSLELEALVGRYSISGKRIHDANIAAVLAVYRIPRLITVNQDDFAIFTHVHTLSPAQALAALPA